MVSPILVIYRFCQIAHWVKGNDDEGQCEVENSGSKHVYEIDIILLRRLRWEWHPESHISTDAKIVTGQ